MCYLALRQFLSSSHQPVPWPQPSTFNLTSQERSNDSDDGKESDFHCPLKL